MKKLVILVLGLLFFPVIAEAANELSFAQDTDVEVNSITLKVMNDSIVDDMTIGATSVTFSLSATSSITLRSYNRKNLNNNLGLSIVCGAYYSQISVDGIGYGPSLVVTPSATVCDDSGGGDGGGGGGGTTSAPSETTEDETVSETTSGEEVITSSGGELTATTDEDSMVSADVPADAVEDTTTFNIVPETKSTITDSRPVPADKSIAGGYVYDFTASSEGQSIDNFKEDITLTFTYTDSQISGLDELSLGIYYWDSSDSQWKVLTTIIDAANNILTATTDHFTYFAIIGTLTQAVSPQAPAAIQDGDLIRNPNAEGMAQFDIYIAKIIGDKKFKRLILSPHVFESYEHFDKNGNGDNWDDVLDVNQATMDSCTTSDLVRPDGQDKVYRLIAEEGADTGTKHWLNMAVAEFDTTYDSEGIYTINDADIAGYTTGSGITEPGAEPTNDGTQAAQTTQTIIITNEFLRVRSLPSLIGEILVQVYEGEVYEVLEEQNGWYKITTNGITGWCFGNAGQYAAKQ